MDDHKFSDKPVIYHFLWLAFSSERHIVALNESKGHAARHGRIIVTLHFDLVNIEALHLLEVEA